MKLLNIIDRIQDEFRGSVATIGNFDGVHLGHRHLFGKVVAEAGEHHCRSVVITFDPHPKMILHPEIKPFYLITSVEEKVERIAEAGIDGLMLIPFSMEFSRMTAKDFVRSILWERFHIRKIFIGHDYTFGRGKEGNEAYLAALGKELGFQVEVISAFKVGDSVISSTLTRNTILAGDVKKAASFLGRPYSLSGVVTEGHRRGRDLGFPTANIRPDKELLPARGIYAVRVGLAGRSYKGVLNIGYNPTFSGQTLSVEVYILDFIGDIYGERLELSFIDRIRDEVKFDGPAQLADQIRRDVEGAVILLDAPG